MYCLRQGNLGCQENLLIINKLETSLRMGNKWESDAHMVQNPSEYEHNKVVSFAHTKQ